MNADVRRYFGLAVEIPEEQRAAFLNEHCTDTSIRREVESLLGYEMTSETLFAQPVHKVTRGMQQSGELAPGDAVGPYLITDLIGHGGMGAVYYAKRADSTFEQTVAVKVLRAARSEFLLDRFAQERRILALLNHPNIAHILDGGELANGRPWFAMEYVAGRSIDQYCSEEHLTLQGCLQLFLKICDAVSHAHQNLIIHRDLKPGNILVTDQGEPKLLDFGIAKIIDPTGLADASTRLMTPEYASPEQIRGDAISTTSDVYSLGAVLYRVLTGNPPHAVSDMAPLNAAYVITEEPVKPASSVRPGLPADIDAILGKALHKEASRRYRSVQELAQDIRSFLQGRPVLAVPDVFCYRAVRFVQRHAVICGLSALALLSLVTGTAISIQQAHRARGRFQQVRQLANVFLFDFERSIQDVPGTLEARKLVIATAQKYLGQLAAESGDDPELQREIATAYQQLAEIQYELPNGDGKETILVNLKRAYELRRRLGDDRASDPKLRESFIKLASQLAERYQSMKNAAEAARWDNEAATLAERWVDSDPQDPKALDTARLAFSNQGLRLETAGQAAQSRAAMDKAVLFAEKASSANQGDPLVRYNSAMTESTYANMLLNLKEPAQAVAHAEHAIRLAEPLYRADPQNLKWRQGYERSLSSAGIASRALGTKDAAKTSAAVVYLERARALALESARQDPRGTNAKDNVVVESHRLARAFIQAGRLSAAASLYNESFSIAAELTRLNPLNRRYWYLAATNQMNYGFLRLEQKMPAQAKATLESADPFFVRGLEFDPHDAVMLESRCSQLAYLAEATRQLGDRAAARSFLQKSLNILQDMIARDASAKNYIGEYHDILTLAHQLGMPTGSLPPA